MSPLSDLLPAFAFEVQAGRVEKHDLDGREEVAPAQEELFFDPVLAASCRQGVRPDLDAPFAEPGHAPVQMLQLYAVDALDGEVHLPLLGGPVAPRREESVQDGEENRPLERVSMASLAVDFLNDLGDAEFPPQSLEHEGWPERHCRARPDGAFTMRVDDADRRGVLQEGPGEVVQLS